MVILKSIGSAGTLVASSSDDHKSARAAWHALNPVTPHLSVSDRSQPPSSAAMLSTVPCEHPTNKSTNLEFVCANDQNPLLFVTPSFSIDSLIASSSLLKTSVLSSRSSASRFES